MPDDPTTEIEAAGHDRCPVILQPDALDDWLDPAGSMPEELIELLGHKRRVTFTHKLAEAV